MTNVCVVRRAADWLGEFDAKSWEAQSWFARSWNPPTTVTSQQREAYSWAYADVRAVGDRWEDW